MQDEVKGQSEEEPVKEVRDDQVRKPPAEEKEAVRSRVFTRWINALLAERDPPVEVTDLFTEVQDGSLLMAVLEELSGDRLLYRFRSSSHRIFRLNNISKALAFLDDRHVKLLGIDASSIADGVPSVVLDLIWNIILHFQVKEVTGGLQRRASSSLSSLSVSGSSSAPPLSDFSSLSLSSLQSKGRKSSRRPTYKGRALRTLLQWVQGRTSKSGVEVQDFGKSWRSGLAFLAVIKSINPALVDLRKSLGRESRENIQLALDTARHSLDIPPLLEPEDVLCSSPDEKSIITYVSMFLMLCSGGAQAQREDTGLPGIPNFGSLESVTLGDMEADNPKAKAMLTGFERSSEQRLWRRWTRRKPGGAHTLPSCGDLSSSCGDIFTSCQSHGASPTTSTFTRRRRKCPGVLKPPSPLDAGVVSPEICSWMEKGPASGQRHSQTKRDESRLSLSSEEGIYNLSALDSDEEEAYNYILELNKDHIQPFSQPRRQVPRVDEETDEEELLSDEGQQAEEDQRLTGDGYRPQEDSLKADTEPESQREDTAAGHGEDERKKETVDTPGHEQTKAAAYEAMKTNLCEGQRGTEEEHERVRAMIAVSKEGPEEELRTFEDRQLQKLGTERETGNQPTPLSVENIKVEVNLRIIVENQNVIRMNTHEEENSPRDQVSRTQGSTSNSENHQKDQHEVRNQTGAEGALVENENNTELQIRRRTKDHPGETSPQNQPHGGGEVHGGPWTPAAAPASRSLRGGGFVPQPLAPSAGLTPPELQMLLVLWILIYCALILRQVGL